MTEKILIVDDNEINRKLVNAILISEGYNVVSANNGQEGFDLFNSENPDLVITDANMPLMNGFELSKSIRDLKSIIPIIFLSATYNDLAHRLMAVEAGANDYMSLPFNNAELIFKVKNLLKLKQLENSMSEVFELSKAVEQSSAMVIIADINVKITYVNEMFEKVTEYNKEEVIGKDLECLEKTCSSAEKCEMFWNAIANNGYWYGEFCNKKKDGQEYWEYVSISSMKNEEGEVIGYIKVALDITDRKEHEECLEKAKEELEHLTTELLTKNKSLLRLYKKLEKEKKQAELYAKSRTEFIANISHDLRTPLNAILGFSELLKEGNVGPLNEKQLEYITNIWKSGKYQLALINDILIISKIEAGKMELFLENFDLKNLITTAVSLVSSNANKKGISVVEDLEDIGFINADEKRIKQVVYNLLSNAIKFTHNGGSVGIELKKEEDNHILVSVWDTGVGIDEKDKDKIFGLFERLNNSDTQNVEGTGLGLAISKRLIELHGGRIWFESVGKDKGTKFLFTLPII